jgi:hypothetical protein
MQQHIGLLHSWAVVAISKRKAKKREETKSAMKKVDAR